MDIPSDPLARNWAPDKPPTPARRPGEKIKGQYQIYGIKDSTTAPEKTGMGVIYICYDLKNKFPCVLKTFQDGVFDQRPQAENYFRKEAGLWARLDRHENIVKAFWLEEVEGKPYLVLDYIRGGDLDDWLDSGVIDLRLALDFAWQISKGMSYASNKLNLIHRDLKPANILITENKIAKITDFGLALVPAIDFSAPSTITRGSKIKQDGVGGSPAWMAPEQFVAGEIDTRADIYSFGIILYQMLSGGKHPYPRHRSLWKDVHAEEQPLPLGPGIPEPVKSIVDKCLWKNPSQRYRSFEALKKDISIACTVLGHQEILSETPSLELEVWELSNKGSTLALLGRFEEAVDCFNEALKRGPTDCRLFNNRGLAFAGMGDFKQALSDYDQALLMNEQYAECYNNRGLAYSQLREFARAVSDFNQAITCDIKLYQAYNNRGLANYGRNSFTEAVRDFNEAILLNPRYAEAYLNRGLALCALETYEDAIEDFERAISLNTGYTKAYYSRGLAYENTGDRQKAIDDYRVVLALGLPGSDPHVTVAEERIALLRAEVGLEARLKLI